MELLQKLQILMKRNGIKNISQLSRATNIPYTTLKSIFDGDVNDIRLSTSRKLCDYFKITLDDLLDDNIELNNFRLASFDGINVDDLNEEEVEEVNNFVEYIRNRKKTKED